MKNPSASKYPPATTSKARLACRAGLKIGEAAKLLGVSIDTLRRWEKAGKIKAERTPGGTRLYSLSALKKINPSSVEDFQTSSISTEELLKKTSEPQETSVWETSFEAADNQPEAPKTNLKNSFLTKFLIGSALIMTITLILTSWIAGSYLTNPKEAKQFFKNNIASGFLKELGFFGPEPPPAGRRLSSSQSSSVLAVTASSQFLEINSDTQINGSLWVRDAINGLVMEATSSAGTMEFSAGSTTLTVTKTAKLDQDVSTTATPVFNSLTLAATSKQLSSGSLTFTLPSATTTLVGTDTTQTLTKKSMSGSDNTFTNIPNSALVNSKVTVSAGTNLSGGGDVNLGSSITLSLDDDIDITSITTSGIVSLADGTAAAPALTFTNDLDTGLYRIGTNKIGLITAGSATSGITIDAGGNVGIGTITPLSTLAVSGNLGIGFTGTSPAAPNLGLAVQGNIGIGTTSPNNRLQVVGSAVFGTDYNQYSAPANGVLIQGNVGIGSTGGANYNLDIWGTARITSALTVGGNIGIGQSASVSGLTYALGGLRVNGFSDLTGNVGIGGTASFSSLVTSGGSFLGPNGARTAPTFSFLGDTDNGMYLPSANALSFSTAGNDVLTLTAGGNVGIGTTSPTRKFQVNDGEVIVLFNSTDANGDADLDLSPSGVGTAKIRFAGDADSSFQISKILGNDPVLTINGLSGNVGIGFTSPAATLDVVGTSMLRGTAGTLGLTVTSSGNVGIGTTSPKYRLQINTTSTTENDGLMLSNDTNAINYGYLARTNNSNVLEDNIIQHVSAADGGTIWIRAANIDHTNSRADLRFMIRGADGIKNRMVITSLGNVGIGATLPQAKLSIQGNVGIGYTGVNQSIPVNGLAVFGNVGIGTTTANSTLSIAGSAHIGSARQGISAPTDGLFVDGNVGVGATSTAYNLDIWGTGRITSALTVGGNIGIGASVNASSAGIFGSLGTSTLSVSGNSTLSTLTTSGNTGIGGSASITGLTYALGGLRVNGYSDLTGNVGIGGTAVFNSLMVSSGHILPSADDTYDLGSNAYRFRDLYLGPDTLHLGTSVSDEYTLSYDTSANSLGFNVNGSGPAEITFDSNGNVGIGASLPYAKLSIQGNVGIGYTGVNQAIPANGLAVFGNVGIGTTTANSMLSVAGGAHIGSTLQGFSAPTDGLFVDGNVGIGATTSDNKLDVWGNARIAGTLTVDSTLTNSSVFRAANGSASAPSYSFTNLTNAGLWTNGDGLLLTTGGSNTSGLTVTGAGNVGIGTTAPGSALTIIGNIGIGTSAAGSALQVNGGGVFGWGTTAVAAPSNGLAVSGSVGIGTTSPARLLNLYSPTTVVEYLQEAGGLPADQRRFNIVTDSINTASTYFRVLNDAGNGGTTLITMVHSSGNVGIGDASPNSLFVVGNGELFTVNSSGAITTAANNAALTFSGSTPSLTSGSSVFGIFAGGNVGIGTTGNLYGGLTVRGAGTGTNITLQTYGSGLGQGLTVLDNGNVGIGTTGPGSLLSVAGNSTIGFGGTTTINGPANGLGISGNLGVGTTSPNNKLQVIGAGVFGADYGQYSAPANGLLIQGNVGIGFTSPAATLDVVGTSMLRGTAGTLGLTVTGAGNVGIGVTAPTYRLDVKGTTNVGTQLLRLLDNDNTSMFEVKQDASGNALAYLRDTNEAAQIALATSGSSYFTGGNVGIGTAAPQAKLVIQGNVGIGYTGVNQSIPVNGLAVSGNVGIGTSTANSMLSVAGGAHIGSALQGFSAPTDGLFVDGNVGIGATSAAYNLDLWGTGRITSALTVGGNIGIGQSASISGLTYSQGGLRVNGFSDLTGNVGIGGTAVFNSLMVSSGHILPSADDTYDLGSNAYRFRDLYLGPDTLHLGTSVSDEYTMAYDTTNNRLGFNVNGSGPAEITFDSNGNIGIGTSVPQAKLSIQGNVGIGYTGINQSIPVNGLAVSGNVGIGTTTANSLLSVAGGAHIGSALQGFSAPTDGLFVDGNVGVGATSTAYNLDIWGTGRITSALTVGGNIGIGASVNASSAGIFGSVGTSTLSVSGNSTLSTLTTSGNTGIGGSASITGLTYALGGLRVNGYSDLTGNVGIGASANITSNLYAGSIFTPTLSVSGAGYFNTITTSGNVGIGASASITGLTYALGGLRVNGFSDLTGNVGIGGTAVFNSLMVSSGHILPSADDTYDLGSNAYRFRDLYLGPDTLHIGTSTSDEYTMAYDTTNNSLGFNVNGSGPAEITFDSNGNVGIGTSQPQARLSIQGNVGIGYTGINQSIPVNGLAVSGNVGVGTTTANSMLSVAGGAHIGSALQGFSAPTDGLFVDGNVGVGATSTAYNLDIWGTGRITSALTVGGNIGIGASVNAASAGIFGSLGTSALSVSGNSTLNTLTTSGNTGIGGSASITGLTYALGGLRVNGYSDLTGNVGIGGTAVFNSLMVSSGHILPSADDTYDLGSNAYRFRDLYLGPDTLHIGTSTSDEYTMAYDTTNNSLGFNVNGSGPAEITFDSNGNVGIGTSQPQARLSIQGNVGIGYTGINQSIPVNGLAVSGNVGVGTTTANSMLSVAGGAHIGSALQGFSAPTDGLFVDGNVGVGATSTAYNLDIWGTGRITSALTVGGNIGIGASVNASSAGIFGSVGTSTLSVSGNTTLSTLTTSGNTGIGGSASITGLTYALGGLRVNGFSDLTGNVGVGGTAVFNSLMVSSGHILPSADDTYDLGSNAYRFRDLYLGPDTLHIGTSISDEYTMAYDTTNNRLGFNVNGSGPAEITFDSNGNVGIGTSQPQAKLSIQGNVGIGYTGVNQSIPVNGLAVSGNVGIGTSTANSTLSISGSAHIGSARQGFSAPTDGLFVDGNVGVGATSTAYNLDVWGTGRFSSALTVGGNIGVGASVNAASAGIFGSVGTSTLSVSGASSLSTLTVSGNAGIGASASVTGLTYALGGLRVNGFSDLTGNVGIGASANITSNLYAGSIFTPTLSVSGAGYFNTITTSGNVGIGASASITGLTYALGGLRVNGFSDLTGNVGIGGTAVFNSLMVSSGHILPSADDTYDLGSNAYRFRDLYLGPDTLHIGTSTSDEYTMAYDTTNNSLGFNVNGSGPAEITFDSNGNVGIGFTSPAQKLHILGSGDTKTLIQTTGVSNTATLILQGASYTGTTISNGAGSEQWFMGLNGTDSTNDLILRASASTNVMRIFNSGAVANSLVINAGNVGIGTTVPQAKLSIQGNVGIGYTGVNQSIPVNGLAVFGNVGVGVTTANSKLAIAGGQVLGTGYAGLIAPTNGLLVQGLVGIGNTAPGNTLAVTGGLNLGTFASSTGPSNGLAVSGNVGIGTTSPAYKLDVTGSGRFTTGVAAGGSLLGTVTDTFTRADGAIGSAETGQTWTGSTYTVSSNAAVNTPTAGSELVTNGDMELDSSWGSPGGNVATNERSSTQAHAGTYSRHIVTTDTAAISNTPFTVTAGTWYRFDSYFYAVSGTDHRPGFWGGTGGWGSFKNLNPTKDQWINLSASRRETSSGSSASVGITIIGAGEFYQDDVSYKPLTLSSLFASLTYSGSANVTVQDNVTMTASDYSQAGVVMNLDSASNPQNFVIGYVDNFGGNSGAYTAKLEKNVNGTYTQLISASITYSAGATLKVVRSGTTYQLFYNGTQVGTDQTVSDSSITSNTLHGMFSTSPNHTLDSFSLTDSGTSTLFAVGSGNLLTIDNTGRILLPNGSATAPSFAFTGSTLTGIFSSDTNNLNFTTNGSERLRIDSSGNIGIGTSQPQAKLSIQGNVGIGYTGVNQSIPVNGLAVFGNVGIGTTTANSLLSVAGGAHIGSARQGFAAPTDGLFVDGNVGIGTTTSDNKLDVWGNARVTGTLTVDSTLTNSSVFRAANGSASAPSYSFTNLTNAGLWTNGDGLLLTTGGSNTSGIAVTGAGNIGIGTTAPGALLHVGTGTAASITGLSPNKQISLSSSTDNDTLAYSMQVGADTSRRTAFFLNEQSGLSGISLDWGSSVQNFALLFGNSEKFRFTAGGNLGIGTTVPQAKLSIQGNVGIGYTGVNQSIPANGLAVFGNVGIGTTTANSLLSVAGGAHIGSALQGFSAPTDGLFVDGNVGIGATTSDNKLDVWGNARIAGTGTFDSTLTALNGLIGYTGVTAPTSGLAISGNLGIGTTSPAGALHVVGQCVAQGTRIRRRRRGKNGEWIEEDIPVEDIKPDDEVLSLNDRTGEWEWHKVEKTMDMGIQEVFELLTKTGKSIQTTSNHPYLVKIKNSHQKTAFSDGFNASVVGKPTIDPQVVLFAQYHKISKLSSEKYLRGPDGIRTRSHYLGGSWSAVSLPAQITEVSLLSHKWIKVSQLKKGMEIATADGFEEIVSIKKTGRKQTYDLQIANTHNFLANDIVAHNTYINGNLGIGSYSGLTLPSNGLAVSGNVGIGTTSPLAPLHVWGNNTNSAFFLNGNVGIGTTTPTDPLHIYKSQTTGTRMTIENPNTGTSASSQIQLKTADGSGWMYRTGANYYLPQSADSLIIGDWGGGHVIFTAGAGTEYMRLTSTGNVGIGATLPYAKLSIQGNVGIGYTGVNQSIPVNGLAVFGNVGIGTTTANSLLSVAGGAHIGSALQGFSAPTDGLFVDGNVGIGATTSDNKLDVWGNARVTGTGTFDSTLTALNSLIGYSGVTAPTSGLAISGNLGVGTTSPAGALHVVGQCVAQGTRIRRRRRGKNGEWIEEDIPVEDINPDDEVLSLNDRTGKWEWHKVEKTMDMGIQEVFELLTKTGKSIQTTSNHPYLIKQQKTRLLSEFFDGLHSNELAPDLRSLTIPENKDSVNNSVEVRGIEPPLPDFVDQEPHQSTPTLMPLSQIITKWVKVSQLKKGMEIATADGFEEIVSIKKTGRKQTYDLQIANTHNFLANDIVAHNTYINGNLGIGSYSGLTLPSNGLAVSGNVGIGTTSPLAPLHVWGNNTNSAFFLNGNVGIGTTNPALALHVSTNADGFRGAEIENTNAGSSAAAYLLFKNNNNNNGQIFLNSSNYSGYGGTKSLNFYASAGPLAFMSNGASSPEMVIKSGNVGIGATLPQAKLSIQGNVGIGYTGVNQSIPVNGLAVFGNVGIGTTTANSLLSVAGGAHIGSARQGFSAPTDGLFVDGNVGVGATSTAYNLDIWGTGRITSALTVGGNIGIGASVNASSAGIFGSVGTSTLSVSGNSTLSTLTTSGNTGIGGSASITGLTYALGGLRVNGFSDLTGNVGIGGTAVFNSLMVSSGHILPSADDTYDLGSNAYRFRDLYLGPDTLHIGTSTSDEYTMAYDTTNNRLGFNVNGSGPAEITFDSNGNIGIGTTAPAQKFDVRDGNAVLTDADVAHGMTGMISSGFPSTNTFGLFHALNDTAGGLQIMGITDADQDGALYLDGVIGSEDPTDANPAVVIRGGKKDGTTWQALGNSETVFQLRNRTNNLVTVLGIGNVGIGTSSPLSLLSVAGSAHIGSSLQGFSAPADGLFVDGNVGIGATTSDNKLDVWGNGRITGTLGINSTLTALNGLIGYSGVTAPTSGLAISGNVGIGTTSPLAPLHVWGNNTNSAFFLNGNVGIGTTAPVGLLDLRGGSATIPALSVGGGMVAADFGQVFDTNARYGIISGSGTAPSYGVLILASNATEASSQELGSVLFSQKTSGKSGTNPGSKAQIVGVTSGSGGTTGGFGGNITFRTRPDNGGSDIGAYERMRIDSAGNVGIGTTSPILKLDVRGDSVLYSTNGAYEEGFNVFYTGTASTGGGLQLHAGATGTAPGSGTLKGYYRIRGTDGADYNTIFGIYGGAIGEQVPIEIANATGNIYLAQSTGNVGIGTAAPLSKLHVYTSGDHTRLRIQADATKAALIDYYDGTTAMWSVGHDNSEDYFKVENRVTSDYDAIRFYNSTNNVVLVPESGNVGIGTTSPGAKLEIVNGDIKLTSDQMIYPTLNTGTLRLSGDSAGMGPGGLMFLYGSAHATQPGQVELYTSNYNGGSPNDSTSRLKITAGDSSNIANFIIQNSNMGIGTSAPDRLLHIAGTKDITSTMAGLMGVGGAQFDISGATTNSAKKLVLGVDTTDNYGVIQAGNTDGTAYNLALQPGGGNVGIGTTGPLSKFSVQQSAQAATGGIAVYNSGVTQSGHLWIDSSSNIRLSGGAADASPILLNGDGAGFVAIGTTSQGDYSRAVLNISKASGLAEVQIKAADNVSDSQIRFGYGSDDFSIGYDTSATRFKMSAGSTFGAAGKDRIVMNNEITLSPAAEYDIAFNMSGAGNFIVNSNQLYIDTSTGNVGIGTGTPASKLHLIGAGTTTAPTFMTQNSTSTNFGLAVLDNGNVGIGTTSPIQKLHVEGSTDTKLLIKTTGGSSNTATLILQGNDYTGTTILNGAGTEKWFIGLDGTTPSDNLIFRRAASVNDMVINTSGNVGIGTSQPQARLSIQGNVGIGYTGVNQAIPVNGLAVFGNVGIGTTTANSTLSVAGGAHIGSALQGFAAPTDGLFVDGNVGIGATTSDNKLDVWGNARIAGTLTVDSTISPSGQFLAIDGSKTTPSYSFASSGNGDNGMYLPSANALSFSTADSDRLTITAGGNVGIGLTNPTGVFQVGSSATKPVLFASSLTGNVGIGTSTPNTVFEVNAGNIPSQATEAFRLATQGRGVWSFGFNANQGLYLYPNIMDGSSTFFSISTSNQTTGRFMVNTDTGDTRLAPNGGNVGIGMVSATATSIFQVNPTGTGSFVVKSDGNVGIGRTNPTQRLQVIGGTGADRGINISDTVAASTNKNAIITGLSYTSSTVPVAMISMFATSTDNQIYMGGGYGTQQPATVISLWTASGVDTATAGTERMRIDSGGNVGIGTSAPDRLLHIAATKDITPTMAGLMGVSGTQFDISGATTNSAKKLVLGVDTTDNYGVIQAGNTDGTAYDLALNPAGGNVGLGTGTPVAQLDVRNTNTSTGLHTYIGSSAGQFGILDNGNVGIGTTNPGDILHVLKTQDAATRLLLQNANTTGTNARSFMMIGEDASARNANFGYSNTAYNLGAGYEMLGANTAWLNANTDVAGLSLIAAKSTGYLRFATGGWATANERMRIDSAGNVGLGTGTPVAQLDVRNTNTSTGLHTYIGSSAGQFGILDNGNVGIGTTSPKHALDLGGTAASAVTNAKLFIGGCGYNCYGGKIILGPDGTVNSYGSINVLRDLSLSPNEDIFSFGTSNNEQTLTINSKNSNVGIGTTRPAHKLDVVGTAGLSTGTLWTNTSDSRVKQDIETIPNALGVIAQLKPSQYMYTAAYLAAHPEIKNVEHFGFIAQDFQQVFPDWVTTGTDGYLQVNASNVIPYAIKAIQEQQAQIASQSAEINLQKTALQAANLVDSTGLLNDGWIDNLGISLTQNQSFVNGLNNLSVELPGVEPGGLGLSIQPSKPASPTSITLSQLLTNLVNAQATQSAQIAQLTSQLTPGESGPTPGVLTEPTPGVLAINSNVGIGTTDPGAYKLYINGSGFLNDTGWTYASDSRLKENVSSIGTGLDVITALNPVTFDYINGGQGRSGFIAQEVAEVLPDLVSQRPDGMLTLRTDEILPFAVKAIQELSDKINNLQIDSDGTLIVEKLRAGTITLDPALSDTAVELADTGIVPTTTEPVIEIKSKLADLEKRLAALEIKSGKEATASNELRDPSLIAQDDNSATASAEINTGRDDIAWKLTAPDVLFATSSAQLANLQVHSEATVSGQLTAYNLNVSDGFKSFGKTTLGDTVVAGTLTVDGMLSIENGNEINVIGFASTPEESKPTSGVLYLQKSSLARGLDILNGAFTFDKNGTLEAKGTVLATQFAVKKGSSTGKGTIVKGSLDTIIENTYVDENSVILITSNKALNQTIAVADKIKGGFLVELAKTEETDITFDYLIVGVK